MNLLPTDHMAEVTEVFQGSYAHVLGNYAAGDARSSIEAFVAEVILLEKPYLLVTQEGVQHIVHKVFGNEHYRDFIFTLSFTFFSRWGVGDTGEDLKLLAANLARGVAQGEVSREYIAVPIDIATRLLPENLAYEILVANKWLMIVLLLQLCVVAQPLQIASASKGHP